MSEPDPSVDGPPGLADLQKARRAVSKANSAVTKNTKIVACMDSFGFPSDCTPVYNPDLGKTVREFHISPKSVYLEFAHLNIGCVRQYVEGQLEDLQPMHPLCVAMRGQHNYDRMLDMQKMGVDINLRSVHKGVMTTYRTASQLDLRSKFHPETVEKTSMALVAALGGVGLPVVSYDGPDGARRYFLPRFGWAILNGDKMPYLEDAASPLFEFDPTPQDPYRLAIYASNPMHPVSIAYNALRSRVRLRDLLFKKVPRLHAKDGSLQAIVTANYSGRVMEHLTQRFGSPPIK